MAEYGLHPDPDGIDADLRDIQAVYLGAGGALDLLVDAAGSVIGSVGLVPVSSSTCELRKMYLLPAARGRGLERRLLEHALARATGLGFTSITVVFRGGSDRETAFSGPQGFQNAAFPNLFGPENQRGTLQPAIYYCNTS